MSTKPNYNVRVTTETDKSEDLSNVLIQHKRFTESQRVIAMKTMIMRGLSEYRISDSNIPAILNNIPDDIYIGILNNYWDSDSKDREEDIRLLANAIASMCGMYRIQDINTGIMVTIISRIVE